MSKQYTPYADQPTRQADLAPRSVKTMKALDMLLLKAVNVPEHKKRAICEDYRLAYEDEVEALPESEILTKDAYYTEAAKILFVGPSGEPFADASQHDVDFETVRQAYQDFTSAGLERAAELSDILTSLSASLSPPNPTTTT